LRAYMTRNLQKFARLEKADRAPSIEAGSQGAAIELQLRPALPSRLQDTA
jgi:hypothetical protein